VLQLTRNCRRQLEASDSNVSRNAEKSAGGFSAAVSYLLE
jgi:hypothetical protein